MSSCRGVIIASNTNRARTQMAEALLRYLVRGRVHITSGGVHHGTTMLPQAVQCMEEWGVPMSSQSPSTLAHVWDKAATFDVFISVDEAASTKRSAEQAHAPLPSYADGHDPSLVPSLPAHWAVANDAASVKETWTLWSPRNPLIAHENSTRKFQDHLYEGEPLFRTLSSDSNRHQVRIQRRWEVPTLVHVHAMERSAMFLARVRAARQLLLENSIELIRDLEEHYEEELLDATLLEGLVARGAMQR
jgi:protein-tyrosine-phosphatase